MKYLTLFLLLSVAGCNYLRPQKPFIITYIGECQRNYLTNYGYTAENGIVGGFYDSCNKYSIGDTIQ